MQSMIDIRRKLTYMIGLLMIVTAHAAAQEDEPEFTDDYRATLVITKRVNDKLVLFVYQGYANSPDKESSQIYFSPPGVIYKLKPWLEIWGTLTGVYTDNKQTSDSWELRPTASLKFLIPNKQKLKLYSFIRFENRFIKQDDNLQWIPRIRNRLGIIAPLAKKRSAYTPKTFYALADVEPTWRLDEKRLQFVRARGGIGYVFSRRWRAELIYHAEFSKTQNHPFDYAGNIWRLNIKLRLPRRGVFQPDDDVD
jgi:hypothetical protein